MKRETHAADEVVDHGRLKDVAERDPVQEAEHRLESHLDQRRLVRLFEHFDAERKDFGKLLALLAKQGVLSQHSGKIRTKPNVLRRRHHDVVSEMSVRGAPTHDLRLELLGLCRRHLLGRVLKDLLRQEPEDDHIVFADRNVGL